MPEAARIPAVKIFQICYSEATLANVPAGMMALDNRANQRPDWREYWPIRQYLLNHTLEDNTLYGFLAPRFGEKTGLSVADIHDFLNRKYTGQSVVTFSPFWDLGAFFINVIEQGDFFHDGLRDATMHFVKAAGFNPQVMEAVMHSGNTVYCNYFLADKNFWMKWLACGELLFAMSEASRTEEACPLNAQTRYGEAQVPRKVFVMERLVSMLIAMNPDTQTLAYNTYRLPSSITPLNRFMDEAVQCDAYKQAWCLTQSEVALNKFVSTRQNVFTQMKEILATGARNA
jgi:hypothetical protein